MKTIKKLKNNMKTVAGSALLVGATLTAGAAAVSAQDGGSSGNLGDYPAPFVDDDGEVDTSVVVGEEAFNGDPVSTLDVVAGIEVAGSLGNAAFEQSETTVSAGSTGSWGATNGVTLDTRNDDVYFGDNINAVRSTLTDGDLDVLSDSEFEDDSGTSYDVTQNLNIGALEVQFGNGADELDNEDPALYLDLPAESNVDDSTDSSYVFNMQASIDSLDLTDEDVAGEEIELFGKEYTIASDHSESANSDRDYIKLYGSQQTIDVQTGNETTVTINENDHTIEVVSTDASSTPASASIRVDGNIRQEDVDSEFTIDGQTVRVEDVINVGSNDDGNGIVELAIGSDELKVYSGGSIEDEDDDDYEGTHAVINGNPGWTAETEVSSINVYVGAEDDDEDALTAGESFSHSLFNSMELQFGGLNPDASEEGSEVTFSNSGDDTATIDFTSNDGEDTSLEFAYDSADQTSQFADISLADSDGDSIVVAEDRFAHEDDYIVTDAGDFAHMWEVTSIDVDSTDTTVDIQDAVTGQSVELEAEYESTGGNRYAGTEIVDGQEIHFAVEDSVNIGSDTEAAVEMSWGDGSYLDYNGDDLTTNTGGGGSGSSGESYYYDDGTVSDIPGETSIYTALDAETGASVAFTEPVDFGGWSLGNPEVFELPSTESTDAQQVGMQITGGDLEVTIDGTTETVASGDTFAPASVPSDITNNNNQGSLEVAEVQVGGVVYDFYVDNDGSIQSLEGVALDADQDSTSNDVSLESPAAVVMQPEDDDDNEQAYIVQPGVDDSDNEMDIGAKANVAFTGGSYSDLVTPLESDDDVEVGYNTYGTFTERDTDDQGDFSLMLPEGQSTVGAAVTGMDGELSTEGGGGSETVTTSTPTYQYADGALDTDESVGDSPDENVVLVGGPAVNSLVADLAENDQTMARDEYSPGEGIVQMIPEAFGNNDAVIVAGHSGEDTRAAGEFLADYRNNQEALEGQSQVTVDTQSGSVVQ